MMKEIKGEGDEYADQDRAKAESMKTLVHEAINKYSVENLSQLMSKPEFCLIYSCFYDFYSKDTRESLLPPTLKTKKQKLALKTTIKEFLEKSRNIISDSISLAPHK